MADGAGRSGTICSPNIQLAPNMSSFGTVRMLYRAPTARAAAVFSVMDQQASLPAPVFSYLADEARHVNAISAARAAFGRRGLNRRRMAVNRLLFTIQPAAAAGDRADDAATDTQSCGNRTLRQLTRFNEAIDLLDQLG